MPPWMFTPLEVLSNSSLAPVNCTRTERHQLTCSDSLMYENQDFLDSSNPWFWAYIGISAALIVMAGIMSGLQLGLLSLDYNTLMVHQNAGEPREQRYARKIAPLVRRRHLLLVTLLILNAACLEGLPLFLDNLLSPAANILLSITVVLLFGEIIPQSVCVRWGMAIGAFLSPLVWLAIGIAFPVAWPLAKLLDALLGHEQASFFRRGEWKELMILHQEQGQGESKLSQDETNIITGAFELTRKTVQDCMTPIKNVFMLDMDSAFDPASLEAIKASGVSRIPVYHKTRNSIVGMLLVKEMLLLDPRDEIPIRNARIRKIPTVSSRKPLYEMLTLFRTGRSHLAEVVDAEDCLTVLGVVTLEDVIEELLGLEIIDETDHVQEAQTARSPGKKHVTLAIEPTPTPPTALDPSTVRLFSLLDS